MAPEDNPADDEPMDREAYEAYEREYKEVRVGRVFAVKAWWGKVRGELIPCLIEGVKTYGIYVRPLAGNPHARLVNMKDIADRIGGHPAETNAG